jgi:hypothetical protein
MRPGSKVEHGAGRRVLHAARYRRAALLPDAAVPDAGNDAILRGSYVLDLDAPVRPGILELVGMATESIAPRVDSSTREDGHIAPLDLGIEELFQPFIGVAVRCPRSQEHRPHDLHVLLRHRLRRQPHGFEGFGAVGEDMGAADLPVFEVVDAVRPATLRGVR